MMKWIENIQQGESKAIEFKTAFQKEVIETNASLTPLIQNYFISIACLRFN